MGIEQDIDYFLPQYENKSALEKSRFALYCVLGRIDQVKEELVAGNDVKNFSIYDFVPPAVREQVLSLVEKKIKPAELLILLETTRQSADKYLQQHGYDARLAIKEEQLQEEHIRQRVKTLDDSIGVLEKEIFKKSS